MYPQRFTPDKLIHLTEVDSTNSEAWRRLARDRLPEGSGVWADHQTAGRGQRGSSWESRAGANLTCSFVLSPVHLGAGNMFLLSMAMSLAAHQAVAPCVVPLERPLIKWPNDLYLSQGKCGGLLVENHWQQNQWRHAVAGFGINLNQARFQARGASSLAQVAGQTFSIEAVLDRLREGLEHWYPMSFPGFQDRLVQAYHTHLLGQGQWRSFRSLAKEGQEPFRAQVLGVRPDGKLQLWDGHRQRLFGFKELAWVQPLEASSGG